MIKLEQFQQQMTEFVFHQADGQNLSEVIKQYPEEELKARLAIYQNNTYHSLTAALKDLYPSVLTTIGEDLFSACARSFLDEFPPSNAAMVDFGQDFPNFLKTFPATASLIYLSDLAQVDLIRHLSYHAADDEPVSPQVFSSMDIETLANSKVKAIASVHLLSSQSAIFDIWQLANNEREDTVDASAAQSVLSIRPNVDVNLYCLDQGNFIFLECLTHDITINEALTVADEKSDQFNPTYAISFLIQSGFCGQIIGE